MPFQCKTKTPHLWENHIDDINRDLDQWWMKIYNLPLALEFQWETNHKRYGLSCEAKVKVTGRGFCTVQETQYIQVEIVAQGNSLRQPEVITKTTYHKKVVWPMKEMDTIVFLDEYK